MVANAPRAPRAPNVSNPCSARSAWRSRAGAFVAAAVVASCSESSSTPTADADGGASLDAARTSCPAGTHPRAGESSACDTSLTIRRTSRTIRPARDHHTTTVIEIGGVAYLYVIGGTSAWETIYDEVLRAPIGEDGALGAFELVAALPAPRAGHATVLVGKHLVVSGGHTMVSGVMSTLDTTIVAALNDDGSLREWRPGPSLPTPIMHHTCDVDGRAIYCVGGRVEGNFTSDMAVHTSLDDAGALAPYEAMPALPRSIGFHQSFVHEHALYVAGGLHRDPSMKAFDVLATITRIGLAEGKTRGGWEPAGELSEARQAGAAQVWNGRAYFFGGVKGTDELVDTVLTGSFAPDGRVTDVAPIAAKLSVARMHVHQVPLYKTWIYSVGGRDVDDRSLGTIDVGTFE